MVDEASGADPHIAIVDAHHHLWEDSAHRYAMAQFAADVHTVPAVRATVYVECGTAYWQHGPEHLRPVGEVAYAARMAEQAAGGLWGSVRFCEAIVGCADLSLGAEVDAVLLAAKQAGGGRLKGIRGIANWDADPSVNTGVRPFGRRSLMLDPGFREGFERLAHHGLSYDALQYHPQLPELFDLAQRYHGTRIAINHCGGLLGIGPYRDPGTFQQWRSLIREAAQLPNLYMKIGALSARRCGFQLDRRPGAWGAAELAQIWQPYVDTCIEEFGPQRCMYESNFPPDAVAGSYQTVWNALKLTAMGCTTAEKIALFSGTACAFYGIESGALDKVDQIHRA